MNNDLWCECGALRTSFSGKVECYDCKKTYIGKVIREEIYSYRIDFNGDEGDNNDGIDNVSNKCIKSEPTSNENAVDDMEIYPILQKACQKCGHHEMYYQARQIRSADEGQTIFYTCTKCRFRDVENS